MIRHNYSLDAMLYSQLCILFSKDALDDYRQPGYRLEPAHILPADRRVQGISWGPVLLLGFCLVLYRDPEGFIQTDSDKTCSNTQCSDI